MVLNTIVAESLDDIATQLEQAVAAGRTSTPRSRRLLQNVVKESKQVIFNGDNYSEAWHTEAERRGLPNRRNTIDSLPDLISPKSVKLFGKYGVFTERELHSRYEIFLENYKKTINIESQLTIQIAKRMILPAALRYQARGRRGRSPTSRPPAPTVPKAQVGAARASWSRPIDELQDSDRPPDRGDRRARRGRLAGPRQALARRDHPRDERRPRRRRQARRPRRRRPLAPADLPGDAVHQVIDT